MIYWQIHLNWIILCEAHTTPNMKYVFLFHLCIWWFVRMSRDSTFFLLNLVCLGFFSVVVDRSEVECFVWAQIKTFHFSDFDRKTIEIPDGVQYKHSSNRNKGFNRRENSEIIQLKTTNITTRQTNRSVVCATLCALSWWTNIEVNNNKIVFVCVCGATTECNSEENIFVSNMLIAHWRSKISNVFTICLPHCRGKCSRLSLTVFIQ